MKKILLTLLSVIGLCLAVSSTSLAYDPLKEACSSGRGSSNAVCKSQGDKIENYTKNIVKILFIVVGFISVVVIIISGIKYATANGDAGKIKSAKDTLLYAIVGLIVAMSAYAIVDYVVGKF